MQAPGRTTRKARDFGAEIARLRAQGYTLGTIRQALQRAGVHVSISTVRREANRCASPDSATTFAGGDVPGAAPSSLSQEMARPAPALGAPIRPDERSGRQIAEAFMRNRITNPLIRSREQP